MSSIELFGCWWGHENVEKRFVANKTFSSANAVGVKVAFYNCSGKEIKYISFSFVPYNSVKDVCDEVKTGKLTGPIKHQEGASVFFDHLWFNGTLSQVSIKEAIIEYMDGTTETLNGSKLVNIYEESKPFPANSTLYSQYHQGYMSYFDKKNNEIVYNKSFFNFNQGSTFYKTYKDVYEKGFKKASKSQNKVKIIYGIIFAAIIAIAIFSFLGGLFG